MTRLLDQAWLTSSATTSIVDALEAAGGADCARFVGGCVRNALVGREVDDIDIATRLLPEDVMKALQSAGLKVVPTGLAHGTVTAVSEKRPYEITTLRRDISTDGRRATVAFTDDWAEDAARRDFRLNALYADRGGQVFDPTGRGVEDALAGRVVFVGDPVRRIEEDYLRILRFFRFFAWYGRSAPDVDGLAACMAHAEGLRRLSAERVSKELLKLLAAPDPRAAVSAMRGAGVLDVLIPAVPSLDAFAAMVGLSHDPVLRLSVLLPDDPAIVVHTAQTLRLPKAMDARLVDAAEGPIDLSSPPPTLRAMTYRKGKMAVADRLLKSAASSGLDPTSALALVQDWPTPRLPVGGKEVAKLGVEPGPETGRILKAFEDEWVAADFPVDGHVERLTRLAAPPA